jgi:undecaprenyl-diphosphatase
MNSTGQTFLSSVKELLHREIKLFLILLIIFLCLILFAEIGNMVNKGSTQQFDEMIIYSLRSSENPSLPAGPVWLYQFMNDITALGGGTVIGLITIFVAGFLALQKKYDALGLLLAATIGGTLIVFLLKDFYGRARPDIIFRLHEVGSLSFPSGHSMMSAIVFLTQAAIIARIQRSKKIRFYILSAALFLTFIIGFSRVYLGVHYPTDVIGGWVIGLAWASFCWIVVYFVQKRKSQVKQEHG